MGAALDVGAGARVVAEPVEHDDVEGVVGVAVAASVESVSVGAAAAGRDRRDAAQVGERGFGGDPVGVVAGAGEELAGDLGADTGKGEQRGRDLTDQLVELVVGFADLLGQLLVASGESAQRGLGGLFGVAEVVAGTQPGAGAMIIGVEQVTQLLAQLGWTGDDQRLDLVGGLATGFDRAGAGHAERPDGLDVAVAQLRHDRCRPDRTARAAA